jgi:peroxiredoxin
MRGFLVTAMVLVGSPALAALHFSATATQGGNEFSFHLADALKHGPVVLYFYPAAFTSGCTEEAHEFADATAQFHDLGATVIGVSQDGVEKLKKFSVSECRSKFPVASDKDGTISKEYDAVLVGFLGYSDRTSYVILPDGKISTAYHAMDPTGHVSTTLAAVKAWKAGPH